MENDDEVLVFVKSNKNLQDKFYVSNAQQFQKRLKIHTINKTEDVVINNNKIKEKLQNIKPTNIIAKKVNFDKFLQKNRSKRLKQEIWKRRLMNYDLYKVQYQQTSNLQNDLIYQCIDIEENDIIDYYLDDEEDSSIDSNHPEHKYNDYPTTPSSEIKKDQSESSDNDIFDDEYVKDFDEDPSKNENFNNLFKNLELTNQNQKKQETFFVPQIKQHFHFYDQN